MGKGRVQHRSPADVQLRAVYLCLQQMGLILIRLTFHKIVSKTGHIFSDQQVTALSTEESTRELGPLLLLHHQRREVSLHTFDVATLMRGPEEEPILTSVECTSTDHCRIFRDVFPLPPPSPVKRARVATAATVDSGVLLIDIGVDRYDINLGDEYDDPPLTELPPLTRATCVVKPSVRWP
jgi:hypothetical protein